MSDLFLPYYSKHNNNNNKTILDSLNKAPCFQNRKIPLLRRRKFAIVISEIMHVYNVCDCHHLARVRTFLGFLLTFLILSRFLGLGIHVRHVTLLTVGTPSRLAAFPSPATPLWGE